eukprot:316860_1
MDPVKLLLSCYTKTPKLCLKPFVPPRSSPTNAGKSARPTGTSPRETNLNSNRPGDECIREQGVDDSPRFSHSQTPSKPPICLKSFVHPRFSPPHKLLQTNESSDSNVIQRNRVPDNSIISNSSTKCDASNMSAISLKASGDHRESATNHNSVSRPFKRPRLLETPKKSTKVKPSKSDTALDQIYPGPSYDVELSLQTPIEMKAVDTQSGNTSYIQFK